MIYFKYGKEWDSEIFQKTNTFKQLIQKTLNIYDEEGCLYGLFSALCQAKHRISPFIATHNYSVTTLSCSTAYLIRMNVSPIYHLGPEYPEQHRQTYGAEIEQGGIVELFDSHSGARPFTLGIDAGIAFKHSPISHNKEMQIQFEFLMDGVITTLSCEDQTTFKKITWEQLEIPEDNLTLFELFPECEKNTAIK
jgi:hypothetical protein